MQNPVKGLASWVPLAAPISMVIYGIALDLWPRAAGHVFAAVFRVNPWTLQPIEGAREVLAGIALWLAACYAVGAATWALRQALAAPRHARAAREP